MSILMPTIESALQSELKCTQSECDRIFQEVRGALTQHILGCSLAPQGIFQIRLMTEAEHVSTVMPQQQTYLVVSF